jgi:N-acetylglucosamine-6-sulfatase
LRRARYRRRRLLAVLVLACLFFGIGTLAAAFFKAEGAGSADTAETAKSKPDVVLDRGRQKSSLAQTTSSQPNIVFILTDDMRKDDLTDAYMPQTTTELVDKGMSFQNAFVSNPLCCPSRATIMRGQYSHNTDVWFNTNVFDPDPNIRDGGWLGYNGNGYENENVATRLKAAGYSNGFFGKYLNGYTATTAPTTVPPGWEDWFAFTTGGYFDYDVNDNGTITHFGTINSDYSTDVLKRNVREFIGANAAQGKPFFAYVAPYAPHGPVTPAPRDRHTVDPEKAPRLPSFNERDVTDKPDWIQSLRSLTSTDIANIDRRHENRVESLQAVDDLVATVVRKLGEQGVLSNTYIVFTSDNGFHHGEHRIQRDKGTPYEESVRVPLVIRGPGVAAGSSTNKLVLNTDYLPTFMDLAGARTPPYVDGRSLLPVLTGSSTSSWRTAILIEGDKYPEDPEIPVDINYDGIRTSTSKYIEYEGGFRELYDLSPGADPNEQTNTYYGADPTMAPRPALKARLDALKGCQPQDDPTTPEVEKPCQTAENEP